MKVNIYEAKTNLSRLIQAALDGEDVVIANRGKPLVRLVVHPDARRNRRLDGAAGDIEMSSDFDAPIEDLEEYTR